jgi:two-component system, response regulator PdtaR
MAHPNKLCSAPVVLLVEDDGFVRSAAADAFYDAGFIVLEAVNSNHALSILEVSAAQVAALFTDVQLPYGMDGVSLASRVRERWPWIRLAVTSGLARPPATTMPPNARFFAKPYDIDCVVAHFRDSTLAAA